jgi:site-specific DNA recombinase
MSNIDLFKTFAKGTHKTRIKGSNCVIYTRVSTKEQADNNLSLDTQKKGCEMFAKKGNLQIMGYFGGTYESAKTDERKEFNNMLSFLKKSREKISYIIVYSVDRFSRSGANAIYIAEQLKKQGIVVCSVTQPTDASTASGSLQQNIQFIFSQYENQQRKEKCMAGVKEMLLRGEWCTAPPFGYDIVKANGVRKIVVNSKGKLLRKAFYWKAKEKVTSEEILRRLAAQGLKLYNQQLSRLLRNPFYCGLLVHTALEGQIIEGNHEKLISEELFLEVNGILAENAQGYRIKPENDDLPLKRFLKCEYCCRYMRGYKAYKNQKHYYKCNHKGCSNNKRAEELHKVFGRFMANFSIDLSDETKELVKRQLIAKYNQQCEEREQTVGNIEKEIAGINQKLERIEERFILDEISKEMHDKYRAKFIEERQEKERELAKTGTRVSNLEEYIEVAFRVIPKLAPEWHSADYCDRQEIQFLLFPEGMFYDKKKDQCRTPKVNELFRYTAYKQRLSEENKKGNCDGMSQFPHLVARSGVEPETSGL